VDWLTENDDLIATQLQELSLNRANPRGFDRNEHCYAVARVMVATVADVYGPVVRLEPMRAALIASIAELLMHYSESALSLNVSQRTGRQVSDETK
jgi:hypothetical protein